MAIFSRKYIWIKIDDTLGFSGISIGNSPEDVDNHINETDFVESVGFTWGEIEAVIPGNWYDERLISFLKLHGWVEKAEWHRDNGDVHAPCFERGKYADSN